MTPLILSFIVYSITSIIWTWVYQNQAFEFVTKPMSKRRLWITYLSCLSGSFTPGNLGTEALRIAVNKSQLGIPVVQSIKVSVWTSFLKLGCAILFGSCLLVAFCPRDLSRQTLGVLSAALCLWGYTLYKNSFKLRFSWKEIGLFFVSFCCEYFAFFLCMKQVGLNASFGASATIFSIIHLLARIPLMPQGLIVVEAIGLPLAYNLYPDREQTMMLFATWALVRSVSPLLVGGCAVIFGKWPVYTKCTTIFR